MYQYERYEYSLNIKGNSVDAVDACLEKLSDALEAIHVQGFYENVTNIRVRLNGHRKFYAWFLQNDPEIPGYGYPDGTLLHYSGGGGSEDISVGSLLRA